MSFSNKVVLVTGASSGIGAAIALKFAEEGARVAIVGRNETKLKNVAEKIKQVGSELLVIKADVTKDADAKRIIDDTLKAFGKLDVLINNAGIINKVSILAEDAVPEFDRLLSTNLRSIVVLTNLAGKHLVATKGNIINISSIASKQVFKDRSFCYCTSKAALDHFSRAVALELAPLGVRVNTINPGPVVSDILENSGLSGQQEWDYMETQTPLKRVSDPKETAELALFLASEKSVGITGSSIVTDNGVLLEALR